MKVLVKLIAVVVFFSFQTAVAAPDYKKIMGPDECGECHKVELKAWKKTSHSKTFKKMHKTKEAKAIKKKMGIRRIKSQSACITCHYTSIPKRKKIKPIAGVSCESCHSPAREWMDVHNDFGGKDIKRDDEAPLHKKERLAKVKSMGMIGHNDIYELASNCFQCHTVPNEKLVNVGGHEAGSKFELVSWSQGEVRHNFMRSENGKDNIESTQARKRVMYVVGRGVDLEFSLRALAEATIAGEFSNKMVERVKSAIVELDKINNAKSIAEVAKMIAVGKAAKLVPNSKDSLLKSANAVSEQARKFSITNDGNGIAGIDSLITAEYKE